MRFPSRGTLAITFSVESPERLCTPRHGIPYEPTWDTTYPSPNSPQGKQEGLLTADTCGGSTPPVGVSGNHHSPCEPHSAVRDSHVRVRAALVLRFHLDAAYSAARRDAAERFGDRGDVSKLVAAWGLTTAPREDGPAYRGDGSAGFDSPLPPTASEQRGERQGLPFFPTASL